MIRPLSLLVVLASSTPCAFAQLDISNRVRPITGPIRDGGTYHLATHTWTRGTGQATLVGTNTIYNNTCPSGVYATMTGDTYVDEGRVPSPSGPNNLQNKPGCARQYEVHGFQIGYCTDQGAATFGTYSVAIFETHAACTTVIGAAPTASFALQGLPANVTGAFNCWIVNIDLDAPAPASNFEFTMKADGGGGSVPIFGWSMSSTAQGTGTGPIIAGDYTVCSGFDGTAWDPVVNYAEPGTGMSTQDLFFIEGGATTPGCYYFGPSPPNPFASFHLRLFAGTNLCGVVEPGNVYCAGDGVAPHAACPCGNNSAQSDRVGCLSSIGVGGKLRGSGFPSISSDTLVLLGTQMPASATCLYFQGSMQQAAGNGSVFGDGLRCAGGSVVRLGAEANVSGASQYPSPADPLVSVRGGAHAGNLLNYQIWYRNSASFCTSATFNLSNGYVLSWAP